MKVNIGIKSVLINNFTSWLKIVVEGVTQIIMAIEKSENLNLLLYQKENLISYIIDNIPITSNLCYFCIENEYNPTNCGDCSYSKVFGGCENVESSFYKVRKNLDSFLNLIDATYSIDAQEYGLGITVLDKNSQLKLVGQLKKWRNYFIDNLKLHISKISKSNYASEIMINKQNLMCFMLLSLPIIKEYCYFYPVNECKNKTCKNWYTKIGFICSHEDVKNYKNLLAKRKTLINLINTVYFNLDKWEKELPQREK